MAGLPRGPAQGKSPAMTPATPDQPSRNVPAPATDARAPRDLRPVRPRRSVLYVPASHPRALEKAAGLDADALIFDLEDAVAPEAKTQAREALRRHLAGRRREDVPGAAERVIRINALSSEWGTEDLLAARACRPDAIVLPKVDGPQDIAAACEALDETDAPPCLRIWAMIETPLALMNLAAIGADAADPQARLDCLVVGSNDLVKALGLRPQAGRPHLSALLMPIVAAARAHGLDVLDGVYNSYRDAAGFLGECRQGRAMGFDGKTLIHPAQIAAANTAFGIGEEERKDAEAIVAAFARPDNAGKGVVAMDGRMVERLHLDAAERTLAKAALIAGRQAGAADAKETT